MADSDNESSDSDRIVAPRRYGAKVLRDDSSDGSSTTTDSETEDAGSTVPQSKAVETGDAQATGDDNDVPKSLAKLLAGDHTLLRSDCEEFFQRMVGKLQSYQDACHYLLRNTHQDKVREFWNVLTGGLDPNTDAAKQARFVLQSSLPSYDVGQSFVSTQSDQKVYERMCVCIINLIKTFREDKDMVGHLLMHTEQKDDDGNLVFAETHGLPFNQAAVYRFHGFKGAKMGRKIVGTVCIATQLKVLRKANEYLRQQHEKHPDLEAVATSSEHKNKFVVTGALDLFNWLAPADSLKARLLHDPQSFSLPSLEDVTEALNSWLVGPDDFMELIGGAKLDHNPTDGKSLRTRLKLRQLKPSQMEGMDPPEIQFKKFRPPGVTKEEHSVIVICCNGIFSPDVEEKIFEYINNNWKQCASENEAQGTRYRFVVYDNTPGLMKVGDKKVVVSTKIDAVSKLLIDLANSVLVQIYDKTNEALAKIHEDKMATTRAQGGCSARGKGVLASRMPDDGPVPAIPPCLFNAGLNTSRPNMDQQTHNDGHQLLNSPNRSNPTPCAFLDGHVLPTRDLMIVCTYAVAASKNAKATVTWDSGKGTPPLEKVVRGGLSAWHWQLAGVNKPGMEHHSDAVKVKVECGLVHIFTVRTTLTEKDGDRFFNALKAGGLDIESGTVLVYNKYGLVGSSDNTKGTDMTSIADGKFGPRKKKSMVKLKKDTYETGGKTARQLVDDAYDTSKKVVASILRGDATKRNCPVLLRPSQLIDVAPTDTVASVAMHHKLAGHLLLVANKVLTLEVPPGKKDSATGGEIGGLCLIDGRLPVPGGRYNMADAGFNVPGDGQHPPVILISGSDFTDRIQVARCYKGTPRHWLALEKNTLDNRAYFEAFLDNKDDVFHPTPKNKPIRAKLRQLRKKKFGKKKKGKRRRQSSKRQRQMEKRRRTDDAGADADAPDHGPELEANAETTHQQLSHQTATEPSTPTGVPSVTQTQTSEGAEAPSDTELSTTRELSTTDPSLEDVAMQMQMETDVMAREQENILVETVEESDDDSVTPESQEGVVSDEESSFGGEVLPDLRYTWVEEDRTFPRWGDEDETRFLQHLYKDRQTHAAEQADPDRQVPKEMEYLYVVCQGGSEETKDAHAPYKTNPNDAGRTTNRPQSAKGDAFTTLMNGLETKNTFGVMQNMATYYDGMADTADGHLNRRVGRNDPRCEHFQGQYHVDAFRSIRRGVDEVEEWYKSQEEYFAKNEDNLTFLNEDYIEFRMAPNYDREIYAQLLVRQEEEGPPTALRLSADEKGPLKVGFPDDATYALKAKSGEEARKQLCVYGYLAETLGLDPDDVEELDYNTELDAERWHKQMRRHARRAEPLTALMALNFIVHCFASCAIRFLNDEGICVHKRKNAGSYVTPLVETEGISTHLPMTLKRSAMPVPYRRLDVGTHWLIETVKSERDDYYDLFGDSDEAECVKLGHFSQMSEADQTTVIDALEKCVCFRLLGRTGRMQEFANINCTSPIPTGDEELNKFRDFVESTEGTFANKLNKFISGQMRNQVPSKTKNLYTFVETMKEFGHLLRTKAKKAFLEKGADLDRKAVVDTLANTLYEAIEASPNTDPKQLPMFIAHSVVADFECLAGYGVFGMPDHTSLNFGFGCGLGIASFNLPKNTASIQKLHDQFVEELSTWSNKKLESIGMERDKETQQLTWYYDGRPFTIVDTEHFLCKIGIGLALAHPNRCLSAYPSPPSHYCWPVYTEHNRNWIVNLNDGFISVIRAYANVVRNKIEYPSLRRWFLLMGEDEYW